MIKTSMHKHVGKQTTERERLPPDRRQGEKTGKGKTQYSLNEKDRNIEDQQKTHTRRHTAHTADMLWRIIENPFHGSDYNALAKSGQ